MCTVLIAHDCVPGARLLVAANRDELVARASAGPGVLREVGGTVIVGGRDLVAGGTWLAVAGDGRLAAVTNRHVPDRDPTRRSRGEIPLLLLAEAGDERRQAAGLRSRDYNPANVLLAVADGALVVHLEAGARSVELDSAAHVLTTVDVDSGDKARRLAVLLQRALAGPPSPLAALEAMEAVLRDHGPDGSAGLDAACVHGDVYGTVSSSSVLVEAGGGVVYRHAAGRPCEMPHLDFSGLLRASP